MEMHDTNEGKWQARRKLAASAKDFPFALSSRLSGTCCGTLHAGSVLLVDIMGSQVSRVLAA